jgi:hypothetical protein
LPRFHLLSVPVSVAIVNEKFVMRWYRTNGNNKEVRPTVELCLTELYVDGKARASRVVDVLSRREHSKIIGTKVLENLKLVVLKY